jgi:hypothetical protein
MKITNFRNLIVKDSIATAQVDVTTGFWFWEKTEVKVVANVFPQSTNWWWIDTGETTPDVTVQKLYRVYLAAEAGRY